MTFVRTFFLICAIACCMSESTSPKELKKRYETTSRVVSEPAVGVPRTKGRGKAAVQRREETENVPKEFVKKKDPKGIIKTRVVEKNIAKLNSSRARGGCRECPSDQRIVASKGSTFALLKEPCPLAPRMWNHHSGPRPGSVIQEGTHAISGSLGQMNKFCEYSVQVVVNRCEPLKVNEADTTVECSADNIWGSICTFSCGEQKEALGPNETECREDLTWSNSVPICKNKMDCSIPKVKTKSKISCQTADMSLIKNGDIFPNGSICKFMQNGKPLSITCKNGRWLKSRKNITLGLQQTQQSSKLQKNDACNPNPCKNGGTCLKPSSNTSAAICKCRPQTQGAYCELRECYYNTCENEGLCIYENEESICYCSPEYGGNKCQNYLTPSS